MSEQQSLPVDSDAAPEDPKPTTQDLLINMMMRQAGHMLEYNKLYQAKGLDIVPQHQWGNINHPTVQAKIREAASYCIEEMMEAINLLKNKPWKQTPRETNAEDFFKELADAWHFWLEFMLLCGMTPDQVAKYYFGVAENNDQRRETGY